jgi:hypothetical protein
MPISYKPRERDGLPPAYDPDAARASHYTPAPPPRATYQPPKPVQYNARPGAPAPPPPEPGRTIEDMWRRLQQYYQRRYSGNWFLPRYANVFSARGLPSPMTGRASWPRESYGSPQAQPLLRWSDIWRAAGPQPGAEYSGRGGSRPMAGPPLTPGASPWGPSRSDEYALAAQYKPPTPEYYDPDIVRAYAWNMQNLSQPAGYAEQPYPSYPSYGGGWGGYGGYGGGGYSSQVSTQRVGYRNPGQQAQRTPNTQDWMGQLINWNIGS